ncbi:MAG: nucleotidyltransferase family protein [Acidimicrobiales bacterium]
MCEASVPAGALAVGKLDSGRLSSFRRLTLESALAEISHQMDEHGVRPLLVKGAAFAHWLYDNPRERSYGDIDLLVDPREFEAAMRVLLALDFVPRSAFEQTKERASHHEQLVRGGTLPVEVELHHTLRLVLAPPALLWERLTEGTQTIEVAGAVVRVPSHAASALIAVLHAAQHGDRWLPPLDDMERALDRADLQTWRQAAALAEELGSAAAFAAGLRMRPDGRELANQLKLGPTTARYERLLASVPSSSTLSLERLVSTPGVVARFRLVAAELVPARREAPNSPPTPGSPRTAGAFRTCTKRSLQIGKKLPRTVRSWTLVALHRS